MRWRRAFLLWSALLFLLPGCALTPTVALDPDGPPPPDFAIDLTVVDGDLAARREIDPHAPSLGSRFVLQSDGTILGGPDTVRGVAALPPPVRVLGRREIESLWATSASLGLTDPAAGDEAVNFRLVTAAPGELLYLVTFTGGDRSWCFTRRIERAGPGDPTLGPLVEYLRVLSWGADRPEPRPRIVPRRYDFGPDPYARYRTGGDG